MAKGRVAAARTAPQPADRASRIRGGAFALTRDLRIAAAPLEDPASLARVRAAPSKYCFEPVLAGHRVLAARAGDSVRVVAADFRDWTPSLPQIRRALLATDREPFVVEGTLIALDTNGRPSFERLKSLLAKGSDAGILLVANDLLRDGDEDLRSLPCSERLARLSAAWERANPPLVCTQLLEGCASVDAALAAARGAGLLAVVARDRAAGHGAASASVLIDGGALQGPRAKNHLSPSPHVTNKTKLMYPRDGYSKADVFEYYRTVAPLLLAHMKDHPVVAQRWPDGIDDFTWYQHRVPPRAPDYLQAIMVERVRRIMVDNEDALLWLVNQAALTFHGFASRTGSLTSPDWMTLDLDPGEDTAWSRTIEVAGAVRRLLELLEVESVVKTSGQKGLHILVPLAPAQDGATVQQAAREIAEMIRRLMPDATTTETDRDKRKGRLLIDTTQGFVGKILVLPYSLRATDGATVSAPVTWSEVGPTLEPRSFDLKTMLRRIEARGDLAAALVATTGRADAARMLAKLRPHHPS